MGTPTLSVYEALNGKEAGGSSSLAGHMYYVLTDSNGNTYSFGFAPAATHSPWGQGAVTPMTGLDSDLSQYAPINYSSQTIPITQSQFSILYNYGTSGPYTQTNNSLSQYNLVTNSCINFTWNAAAQIGIQNPNSLSALELLPATNAAYMAQAMAAFEKALGSTAQPSVKYYNGALGTNNVGSVAKSPSAYTLTLENGTDVTYVYGSGWSATVSNSNIQMDPGVTANITGSNNQISMGQGDTVTVSGTNNQVSCAGSYETVNGTGTAVCTANGFQDGSGLTTTRRASSYLSPRSRSQWLNMFAARCRCDDRVAFRVERDGLDVRPVARFA